MKTLKLQRVTRYFGYILLVAGLFSCSERERNISKIKLGQTWKYVGNENNPYEKAIIHYNRIIDVTGEYVLYIQDNKDTLNDTKFWFVIGSELIQPCN